MSQDIMSPCTGGIQKTKMDCVCQWPVLLKTSPSFFQVDKANIVRYRYIMDADRTSLQVHLDSHLPDSIF